MDLHTDQAGGHARGRIFVNDSAHHLPVHEMRANVTADDQVNLVPIIFLHQRREGVLVAQAADNGALRFGRSASDLATHREEILQQVNFSSTYVSLPQALTVEENLWVYGRFFGLSRAEVRARADELLDFCRAENARIEVAYFFPETEVHAYQWTKKA